jgi:hypothetical protein
MDDLTRLEHELEERRSRGEYITPFSRVQFAMARGDGGLIRHALEQCLADKYAVRFFAQMVHCVT